MPSFVRNEGPSSLLIGEQPSGSRSRRQDPAASVDDGQILPASVRAQLQIVDRGVNKTGEAAVGASHQAKVEHPSFGEQKAFEQNKPRTDSYFGKRENTGVEQDVKSVLQEGSVEPQSGGSLEEPKQSGTQENTQFTNRGNHDLQDQEVKQSSSREIKKRIKDIRALWEREETSNLGSKRELLNKNTTTSKAMLNSNKEPQRVKPVGGSSGYVTAESDSEQGKCNLVTFKKVILNEDESQPDDGGLKSSFGMATRRLIDNSKQSYPVERSGKIFPSDQKKAEFIERSDGEDFRPRPSTKDGGYLQPAVLQKEKTTSALQQKTHFKIHSLKEQLDEDAKAQMLSPSQFKSLRSFWDVGVKPQSGSVEYKVVVSVPRSENGRAGNDKKEAETGVSQNVLEGAQEKQFLQEVKVDKPNAKLSTQNISETSRVISTEAGPPEGSPSVDAAPKGSVEFVLGKDRYLEGKLALPAKEYIERTEVPSRGQRSAFNSGFQKLLIEAFQESPPAAEKGVPSLGLAVQEQMPLDDRVQQQQKLVPAGGQVEISASEVAVAANRTLAPLKAETGALDGGLEKQSTEATDARTSPKHSGADDVSGQAVPSSQRRRFFNKVMERSHASYLSGQQNGTTGLEEAKDTLNKHASPRDHHDEVKTGTESLSRPTEESHSIPRKAPDREEGHRCLEDRASLQDTFQIPSVKLMLPDPGLSTQNKASSAATEVSETMTEVIVPSKKICHDMNAKIACLLDPSSTLPCVLPTTENALKTHIKDTLGERQPGSFFAGPILPSSPQRVSSLRDTTSESTEGSPKGNEDGGRVLTTADNEPGEVATGIFSFRSQKNLNAEGYAISGDEPPRDVTETVVKTLKADSYEPTALRASLRKFLREDSEVTEVSKPTQMPLETVQNVSSIYDTLAPHLPEIIETIEKTTLISHPRQSKLKASFQKLLKEESEILPANQETRANNNGIQTESKSNQSADLLFDPQEIGKETSETGSPSKQNGAEVNSSLQKLLDDADWMHTIQLASLDPPESIEEWPQEAKETVIKSTAPAKDDAMLTSNLRKLIREHHDASLRVCREDNPRVTDDSTSPLKKQSSSVKMLASAPSASNEFRTEVKIPLKGKTSKQDDQTEEGVPERTAVFQNTIQVITSSAEAAQLDRGEEPPICSNKTGERKRGYDTQREAEVTIASLRGVNEAVEMVPGAQGSSTSCAEMESPLRVSNVKLHLGTQKADDKNNEEGEGDARSFGSDLSDENTSSFVRIQRNRTRSEEEPNPVMEALKRSSNRQIPSKSLEDIPSATSNQGKLILPKEDYMLSAEDDQKADQPDEKQDNVPGISTAPSFPDSQFSRPEKVKQMSKSVPAFVQEESDDRETDSASDSSYPLGRIKKSPSSLTNLSSSSGLASLSSVSTSAMSVYSGDFGNVDVKGNIQFAIDYVEQLKELHIFIAQGKDLAIADVKKQRSDPYVKSYLLPEKYKLGKRKTSVKKKTLNPVFNEILRYKVDKELLATQRLNISVWHSDTFGRNSFLGEVELDLASWDWNDKLSKQMIWYPLKPRTPLASLEAENRGEVKIALKYIPQPAGGKKTPATGEVHIWVKECKDLLILRNNKLNSFVKCTILPDTSRKSRQKTRAVANTTNPVFNHTMVYDGFRPEDLKEACVELTVWDHNKLANHFLGGLRIGLGTGKSYGTPVDWMDSTCDEIHLWERMINSPNTWVEDTLPLRMLTIVKMAK
ncbi:hypothetical protein JRQ81_019551 [Phrynocephalus forsythii]|uniref:Synaptotagmin-like protein 2 n=1 Tax=Phrynocephalus forsythii TaxID=171643 RepID=A0A9Q0XPL0_9SAUR|nr:hypothetical protein JRQ81_019551 [Phrynocephalus forsythii]